MGVAATTEHLPLVDLVDPRTVLDVGANKGQFALFSAGVWPGCRIIAFEPLPEAARVFRRVTGDLDDITLHEVAIAPFAGNVPMFVSRRANSSSLLPISLRQTQLFPGTELSHQETVEARPIPSIVAADDLVPPVLLKIDVQGYELDVLRSAEPLLALIDFVYVECSAVALYEGQALADDVDSFLVTRGYRLLADLNPVERDRLGPIQSDRLFGRIALS